MKTLAVLSLVALAALLVSPTLTAQSSTRSCDGYGDCVSSSIAYTRANPDNSLYLGDQFTISLQTTPGSGAISCGSGCSEVWTGSLSSVSWSYDQSVFSANSSYTSANFLVIANLTGSYAVSAAATFLVYITTCVTTSTSNGPTTTCYVSQVSSPVTVSQQVQTLGFVLSLKTWMTNATTPLHQLRRNPDGTFYSFDAFYTNYSYSFQFMQQRPDIGVRVEAAYDQEVLDLVSYKNSTPAGQFFFQMANKTGPYAVTLNARAFNWLGQTLGSKNGSTPYTIIPLVVNFHTMMENVTAANRLVTGGKELMRNPDGSFYRNDSFSVGWTAVFKFSNQRTDISINVTSFNPQYLKTVGLATDRLGRNGTFTYRVGVDGAFQPYSLVLRAEAFNSYNDSLALTESTQPYAVVQYRPTFAYFTYMLYNSRNASAYQRDFVTLVRYGGNDPSYSYTGDANTAPITAGNDTRERAWVNDFTFSNVAWSVQFSHSTSTLTDDLLYTSRTDANITIRPVNSTFNLVTWQQRVQKFYFFGNGFQTYTTNGTIYFDIAEHAFSKDFAGSRYALYNSTYLYEPVYYNGWLSLTVYDSKGKPDPLTNVTLTVHNTYPLNSYLLSKVKGVFGDDPGVLKAFQCDLYQAYNTTEVLQPAAVLNGTWKYLINQTSLGFVNASLPYFTVTATGHGNSFTYTFDDSFSTFLLDNATLPALPFENVTSYYVNGLRSMVALPLSFNFSSYGSFVFFSYNSSFFSDPSAPLYDYGHTYGLIYGSNSTVYANLDGGQIKVLTPSLVGTSYSATLVIPNEAGGVVQVWVKDPKGQVVVAVQVPPTNVPPSPAGFFGLYPLVFLPTTNGTYTIGVTNSWGVSSVVYITSFISVPASHWPPISDLLVGLIAALVIGFYFLGRAVRHSR